MKLNDAVSGIAVLLFAVAMLAYTLTFPTEMPGQNYGPALFPRIIGVGLAICGVLLIIDGLRNRRAALAAGEPGWTRSPALVVNFLLVIGVVVFYILASGLLGFIPTAILVLLALFLRLGAKPLLAGVLAVVVTLAIHQAFAELLRVPLPIGPLQGLI